METVISIVKVVHIVTAILMAWPFYALVIVNQRAHLGSPLGDRTDVYLENIVKNRTIPCFIFQATALISGLALIYLRGQSVAILLTNFALGLKFLLLLLIGGLLTYVHINLQPQINALFAQASNPASADLVTRIGALRLRRKRLTTICLFVVLTNAMLGVQVWSLFPLWLTILLVIAIGLFTWRAYSSTTPYGWV